MKYLQSIHILPEAAGQWKTKLKRKHHLKSPKMARTNDSISNPGYCPVQNSRGY
jgi:hypothetical protein